MDVKIAFLHGDLHEDICMQQPKGFVVKGKEHLVCKLKKSLYGLKKAPSKWYHKFHTFMLSQGNRWSDIDHCLYTKRAKDGSLQILILYVDDMLLAEKNIDELAVLQSTLNDNLDMKDLGDVNHILGMRIGKALSTPLPPHVKLCLNDCPKSDSKHAKMAKVPYSSAIGSLMYAMICTHPNIAFAVGVVSR
ncbi:hypothetical protein L7F22_064478 [Adiantum nelumboides]|nr:hypothetical protein [Adiantum nelumboides]